MQDLLRQHGIVGPREPGEPVTQTDYIEHGSPEHAAFLGLVPVNGDERDKLFTHYTSQKTGNVYRLEDELAAAAMYSALDTDKAIMLVLRQKVNELENKPEVPADALPMFQP